MAVASTIPSALRVAEVSCEAAASRPQNALRGKALCTSLHRLHASLPSSAADIRLGTALIVPRLFGIMIRSCTPSYQPGTPHRSSGVGGTSIFTHPHSPLTLPPRFARMA